jgi:polyferredoxin
MKHGTVTVTQPSIILGSKRLYVGPAPYPSSYTLVKGNEWVEFDVSDNYIEHWIYTSPSIGWVSKTTYEYKYSDTASIAFNASTASPIFTLDPRFKILLLNFLLSGVQNTTASGTNLWNFTVDRIANPATVTNIGIYNSSTPTSFIGSAWNSVVNPINVLIDVGATNSKVIRVTESRVGTPTKTFNWAVEYRRVRI